jgi:hypothetical protein
MESTFVNTRGVEMTLNASLAQFQYLVSKVDPKKSGLLRIGAVEEIGPIGSAGMYWKINLQFADFDQALEILVELEKLAVKKSTI